MRFAEPLAIGLALALGACGSGDAVTICEVDMTVCPEPNMCIDGICVSPDPDAFCEINEDGTECDGGNGVCSDGVCVPYDCGNGVVEGNEFCDGAREEHCTELGYDFGAPSCESCGDTPGTERCGFLGWRSVGNSFAGGESVYANGDEVWVARGSTSVSSGYYFDGRVWTEEAALAGSSVHGSASDEIWVFGRRGVRHFTGEWSAAEPIGLNGRGAVLSVSASEAYLASADAETSAPTIWQWLGGNWSPVFSVASGAPYVSITMAGETLAAVRDGALYLDDASGRREILDDRLNGATHVWGRSADDIYISAGRGFHYDGTDLTQLPIVDVITGLGDFTYFIRSAAMRAHRQGTPLANYRSLKTPEPVSQLGLPVTAFSDGNRIVAATATGVFEFTGMAYSTRSLDGAVLDHDSSNDTLYWLRNDGLGSRTLAIVGNAFAAFPNTTESPADGSAFRLWGRSPTEVFISRRNEGAPDDVIRWVEGQADTVAFTATGLLWDIAGASADSAMAVGEGAWLFDGTDWNPADGGLDGATLTEVLATADGFVALSQDNDAYVWRGTVWEAVGLEGANFTSLDGSSVDDFWVVGFGGALTHCTGNPTSCADEALPKAYSFNDVTVVSPSDILAVAGPVGLHFDGARWTEVNFGLERSISSVSGAGTSFGSLAPTLSIASIAVEVGPTTNRVAPSSTRAKRCRDANHGASGQL